MIRRLFRRGLRIGAVVGAILFLIQIFLRNPSPKRDKSTERQSPGPAPRRPNTESATPTTGNGAAGSTKSTTAASTATADVAAAWVEPEDGVCPTTHPVKVKLASGIFHVPGGLAYERTSPDRCYRDLAAAEADGFRPSKR